MGSDSKGAAIAVLACGTRGDVQPLLALSLALKQGLERIEVTLVTHEAHRVSQRGCRPEQTLCRRHRRRQRWPRPSQNCFSNRLGCRHGWRSRHTVQGCSFASCPACRHGSGMAPRQQAAERR